MDVFLAKVIASLAVGFGTFVVYCVAVGVHRAYFCSLAKIPGPRLWAASRLPMFFYLISGQLPFQIAKLHEKYGPVVRLAPREVSFINEEAWQAIYGRITTKGGRRQMMKDPLQFKSPYSTAPAGMLFEPDDAVHARLRRQFSSAFSEKAVRDQEPLVLKYIDKFIARLREKAEEGTPVDLCQWFSYVAFDQIGDLVFGQSFQCLETDTLHPWITMLFDRTAGVALTGYLMRFGPIAYLLYYLVPKNMRDAEYLHREMTRTRLDKRLAETESRSDFLDDVIRTLDTPTGLAKDELVEICRMFVTGGSETSGTLLSGVTYYLCKNPDKLATLTTTIRSTFKRPEDININTISKVDYLIATVNEGLRIFPPLPGNMRRYTPAEGAVIAGTYIESGTLVAVDQYAAYHSPLNFHLPASFIPERWLASPPPSHQSDRLRVVQPFSVGPRNCIGKTLAYMEMRLLLARLLFAFDIELDDPAERGGKGTWLERCKVYGFWKKPPLLVRLRAVGEAQE